MKKDHVGAAFVLGGAGFYLNGTEIARLTGTNRLPAMFQNREFVEAGGLVSYAPSTIENYLAPRSSSTGSSKAPNRPKALGVAIPTSLLLRADQVIQ